MLALMLSANSPKILHKNTPTTMVADTVTGNNCAKLMNTAHHAAPLMEKLKETRIETAELENKIRMLNHMLPLTLMILSNLLLDFSKDSSKRMIFTTSKCA